MDTSDEQMHLVCSCRKVHYNGRLTVPARQNSERDNVKSMKRCWYQQLAAEGIISIALHLDWSQWKRCPSFSHSFAFYPGENERIQFEEGFYNTDLPNLEISNLVSDYSNPISSSSLSHVSSSTRNIPKSTGQTISRVSTNPNSTTLETVSYSTFQSHVMSIIPPIIQDFALSELIESSKNTLGFFHGLSYTSVQAQTCVSLLNN
ncbi:hypothetical protein ACTFIW_003665 [Dictyostelium discoideum]